MELYEQVGEEINKRNANVENNFGVLECIYSLIDIINASDNSHKESLLSSQEETKMQVAEKIAKDMDYIVEGQKYIDAVLDVLSEDDDKGMKEEKE